MAWLTQFRQVWRGEREAAVGASYGFVVVCMALATVARWGISHIRADVPFSLYFPAVLLTTVFGGVRIGVASALKPFDGQVRTDYLAAGFHCMINCKIPAD